jgi:hypothetical protein
MSRFRSFDDFGLIAGNFEGCEAEAFDRREDSVRGLGPSCRHIKGREQGYAPPTIASCGAPALFDLLAARDDFPKESLSSTLTVIARGLVEKRHSNSRQIKTLSC